MLLPGEDLPDDLKHLRQQVYVDEYHLIQQPFDDNDRSLSHFLLYDHDVLAASMTFGPAEDSDFGAYALAPIEKLNRAVLTTRGTVGKIYRSKGYYKLLLYAALSAYRREGRDRAVSYSELGDTPLKEAISDVVIRGARRRDVGTYQVECIEGDIHFAMWKLFDSLPPELQAFAIQKIIPDDLAHYAKRKIKTFFKTPFVTSVLNKTLTKQQYLEVQANTYCYVQWTTRILARLLVNTPHEGMFKEISHHLVEEIGHPQMVIDDMKAVGVSDSYLNYVINGMVPNPGIDGFMTTQEAASGFRSDPVAFLGVPIGIEGVTAFMPKEFITSLRELANTWGVKDPATATSFWGSHLIFDNPHNGHWSRTISLVKEHLTHERQVRQIQNYVDNVIDAISKGYSSTLEGILS